MIDLIEDNLEKLNGLCREYRVKRLEVFGSALKGKFNPETSDLDFLVEFLPLEPGQHADAYFGLLHALEELFGCKVDLVMPKAIKNRYFLESINRARKELYAA